MLRKGRAINLVITSMVFYLPDNYYGDGVPFTSAFHSTETSPDSRGRGYVYLCLVLTGKYTIGARGLKEPPEKNAQKPGDRYDSVASDTTDNPHLFVIFHDTQAYPEYLVTFKRKSKK